MSKKVNTDNKQLKEVLEKGKYVQPEMKPLWCLVKVTGEPFDNMTIKVNMEDLVNTRLLKKIVNYL